MTHTETINGKEVFFETVEVAVASPQTNCNCFLYDVMHIA